jgi:rhodanese-related sulfurtransferase
MNLEKIILERKGTIVDVRTPSEFLGGHVEGSINIPLQDFPRKMNELKSLKQPLILCCASGGRSGQATYLLQKEEIECFNAGSWLDVQFYLSQKN